MKRGLLSLKFSCLVTSQSIFFVSTFLCFCKTRRKAEESAKRFENVSVHIPVEVGEEDRLFGSVTNVDIVEALKAQGFTVEKADIRMSTGPLKQVGVDDCLLFSDPSRLAPHRLELRLPVVIAAGDEGFDLGVRNIVGILLGRALHEVAARGIERAPDPPL